MRKNRYQFGSVGFFLLLPAGVAGAWWTPPTAGLLVATYTIRMFGVTAGYHRYFGRRSYKLGRGAQFAMALWWAAHYRLHHRESDQDGDVHSASRHGFWWAYVGWVLSNDFDDYNPRAVERYPELVWLNRHHRVPTVVFGGGWPALLWGYVVSTVVLYHCAFAINSLAHLWGTRRFDTPDESRNNWWLALLTLGEGGHNKHHHSPGSCRQVLRWWELDVTYLALRLLSWFGIVMDLRPFRALAGARA